MKESVVHFFVYGTLTSGDGVSPGPMAGCERVRSAEVRGTLYDTGAYPALLLAGEGRVEGEIWKCPADALPRLDHHEAVDEGLFRRVGVRVDDIACWTYVAGPRLWARLTPETRIRSGRWKS